MPDYPSAATAAAIEAIRSEYPMITPAMLSGLATLALDAAAQCRPGLHGPDPPWLGSFLLWQAERRTIESRATSGQQIR